MKTLIAIASCLLWSFAPAAFAQYPIPPLKTLTLKSRMKTRPLQPASPGALQVLSSLPAHAGQSQSQPLEFPRQPLRIAFNVEPQNSLQIKIPPTKAFRIIFEAGAHAHILDKDASDGEARVSLIPGSLDFLLGVEQSGTKDRLAIADRLYGIQDHQAVHQGTLFQQSHWFQLGRRTLPVPADWHSPDGTQWVLSFADNHPSRFELVGTSSRENAPYPPGIAQIGPEGGLVDLPGLARLELPPRALDKPTVIVLQEQLSAPELPKSYSLHDDPSGHDYVTALIKVQPLGLKLKQFAKIYLSPDRERLGQNHLSVANPLFSLDPFKGWQIAPWFVPNMQTEHWPEDMPIGLEHLGYVTCIIPDFITPSDSLTPYIPH